MERRNKIIRKKTIESIFIVDCISILLFIIALGPWPWNNDINKVHQIVAIIIVVVSTIMGNILLCSLLCRVYSMILEWKESSLMVEKQLPKDEEVEIIPIRDDIVSIKKLKKYAKFYATYDGKEKVSIWIKVNHKEKQFFESLHKEDFTFYYTLCGMKNSIKRDTV